MIEFENQIWTHALNYVIVKTCGLLAVWNQFFLFDQNADYETNKQNYTQCAQTEVALPS